MESDTDRRVILVRNLPISRAAVATDTAVDSSTASMFPPLGLSKHLRLRACCHILPIFLSISNKRYKGLVKSSREARLMLD
ncbi:unnamed protein product [Boreogadus saida]